MSIRDLCRRAAFSLSLGAALLATTPAMAADSAPAIVLPTGNLEAVFAPSVYPNNRDGTLNAVLVAAAPGEPGAVALGRVPRSALLSLQASRSVEPLKALLIGAVGDKGAWASGRIIDLAVRKLAGREEAFVLLVSPASPYAQVRSAAELEQQSPGLAARLSLASGAPGGTAWDYRGRKAAIRFVGDAIAAFDAAYVRESDKRPLDANGNPQLYRWSGARNIGE